MKKLSFKDEKMNIVSILNQDDPPMTNQERTIKLPTLGLIVLTCCFAASPAFASKLTYSPVNPTFGGNPLNTSHLFARAEAINDYEDDSSSKSSSAVDSLVSSLQSRLLSELISNGETGSLVTDDYTLNITDDGDGGLTLTIVDATTGEVTTIQVSGLN